VRIPIKARRDERDVRGVGLLPSRTCTRTELSIKVRVHIYARTGRGVSRLAPPEPDATRPSHLAPTCPVSSRPVAARQDGASRSKTGRDGPRRRHSSGRGPSRSDAYMCVSIFKQRFSADTLSGISCECLE